MTTVRVRILVAIDDQGSWTSAGYALANREMPDPHEWIMIDDLTEHMVYHWIEADLPLPVIGTFQGSVTDAEQQ